MLVSQGLLLFESRRSVFLPLYIGIAKKRYIIYMSGEVVYKQPIFDLLYPF